MHERAVLADWIDREIRQWRQGDVYLGNDTEFVHLANLSQPHSPASISLAKLEDSNESGTAVVADRVEGFVILTQTCDIVRSSQNRPYIEIAPLVRCDDATVEQIRTLRRPAFAYIPGVAENRLVADLDRIMTIEKGVLARWSERIPGCRSVAEQRVFARAIAHKRSRFAFPDDFVLAASHFRRHLHNKHNRASDVGSHLRALREIRVRAAPSWLSDSVELTLWFIKDHDPPDVNPDWYTHVDSWKEMFDTSGRFTVEFASACRLEDLTARDYIESDRLDFDSLSLPRTRN